ncbi:DUF3047 domain-containing protein [Acidovorax sp.]|uniref:DUF3047 domain-containing protein n=1 Tax=Acidovorax sp. TaxID=1872122 RepID=UPI003918D011
MNAMRYALLVAACSSTALLTPALHAAQPGAPAASSPSTSFQPPPFAPLAPVAPASGDQPAAAWRPVGFPKKQAALPMTQFVIAPIDGQRALQVRTASSYGTLVHDWAGLAGTLAWRWRLDEPLSGGSAAPDLTSKAGDDAALKLCVMFDHALDQVPWVERTVLRLARSVSGEALPAATLCYVWDTGSATPLQGANPYTRRVRYISLQTRSSPLAQWLAESRNVADDFIALFGDELPGGANAPASAVPPVKAVVIGADSDNTGSRSLGWVAQVQWQQRGASGTPGAPRP